MTTFDQDDNWASQVFSDEELNKLRKQLQQIEEDHAESQEVQVVSIETMFDREYTHEIMEWLRETHYAAPDGAVSDFLWALGCNICFSYLTDAEWDYDEVLSDHATYFGARMFLDDMDDEEGDDDSDDDDSDSESDDEE